MNIQQARHTLVGLVIACALGLSAAPGFAQTWRAVQDTKGWTWARVMFVNQSTNAANWTVWNCRATVSSTAKTATTDPVLNWDGVVNPGETRYVWLYVMGAFSDDAHIDSGDGGASSYRGAYTPSPAGDSEWVITLAADSTVTARLASGASYQAPSRTEN
jgi:hypothetical protein